MDIIIDNRISKEKRAKYEYLATGNKHSMVLIMCATIIQKGEYRIFNVPDILDTHCFVEIIRQLHGTAIYEDHSLYIDTTNIKYVCISEHLIQQIHGTIYLLPAFLVTFSVCSFGRTGGCQIGEENYMNGKRPIDHILDVIKKFGGKLQFENHSNSTFSFTCDKIENQITIDINDYYGSGYNIGPKPSGATKTAILMAMKSDEVIIKNPYLQSEVYDLIAFMEIMGFYVNISKDHMHICKDTSLNKKEKVIEFTLITDTTEVITYVTIALICDISVNISGLRMKETIGFFQKDISALRKMGVNIICGTNSIYIPNHQKIKDADLIFIPNGILSDHQPFFSLLLTLSDNISSIQDKVWPLRFQYAKELEKLGCKMTTENIGRLLVHPIPPHKIHQTLVASDLRAAAVLLIAAMSIPGITIIKDIDHLHRGYERLIGYINERCECVLNENK